MKTIAAAIFFTAFAGPLLALQWHWPDRPTNLKVVKLHIEMYPGFASRACIRRTMTKAGKYPGRDR